MDPTTIRMAAAVLAMVLVGLLMLRRRGKTTS